MQLTKVVFLVLILAVAIAGFAQNTATISGKVEDSTGAALAGATVTVRSAETGSTRVVATDDTGYFRALSLGVGFQELKAEKPGFKAVLRSGIKLDVGQEAVINLRLEVGDLLQ